MATIYFGKYWDVPALNGPDAQQVEVPVGKPCWRCDEAIEPGDQGYMHLVAVPRPHRTWAGFDFLVIHKECQLASLVGNLACLQGRCDGHSGDCHEIAEAEGRSMREDAVAAWAYVQEHKLIPLGGGYVAQRRRPAGEDEHGAKAPAPTEPE